MSEQTGEITITWGTRITEEYRISLPVEAIAGSLEMTVAEVLSAHARGELPRLIDTDWLAEWEDDKTGGYVSTDDRRVRSVEDSKAKGTNSE